jgi:protein subunit release factor B
LIYELYIISRNAIRNTTYAIRDMIDFGVTDRKAANLQQRMSDCKLFEKDITEKFIRSSGPGGQNVNKTSTCVQLTHSPSGLALKMKKTRSQGLNRYYARIRLCEILEQNLLGKQSPQSKKLNKIRKQKDRRKRRTTSNPPKK